MKPAKNPYHALAHLVMRFPRCPLGTIIDALECDDQLHAAIRPRHLKMRYYLLLLLSMMS